MGQIHILDLSVANLIAAGEVVERPASAIKELTENAIDAGATSITVEIQKGGVAFFRVTDNGCGMSAEDAVLAVRRHATSKIQSAEDLNAILTLGFRGEALAAITAVTEFRIMTKQPNTEAGTLLSGAYGTVNAVEATGCPDGTTVICEKLFATTPARLKFLKSDVSEGATVAQTMEKLALSHPEIAFRLIADGNLKFATAGDGNLKNAIYSVYGGAFAANLIEINGIGAIGVSGYVTAPEQARGNRAMQQFYINRRCVRSKTLSSALEAAFRSYIPSDKFPSCVLNLTLPTALVDVNIHPAKMEVKFSNEKAVFDAVYSAVRGTLAGGIARPTFLPSEKKPAMSESEPAPKQTALDELFAKAAEKGAEAELFSRAEKTPAPIPEDDIPVDVPPLSASRPVTSPRVIAETSFSDFSMRERLYGGAVKTVEIPPVEPPLPKREPISIPENTDAKIAGVATHDVPPYRLIGEAFAGYLLIETGDRLILIDKHAAHERINFERLRANMTASSPSVQLLLVPDTLALTVEEAQTARDYQKELSAVGFEFTVGEKEVKFTGMPQDFTPAEAKTLFAELLTRTMEYGESIDVHRRDYFEHALYQSACKASVKAGRVYDEAHLRWICDNLLRYDCIKFCPHGRPVAFEITKKELEARFGRT